MGEAEQPVSMANTIFLGCHTLCISLPCSCPWPPWATRDCCPCAPGSPGRAQERWQLCDIQEWGRHKTLLARAHSSTCVPVTSGTGHQGPRSGPGSRLCQLETSELRLHEIFMK